MGWACVGIGSNIEPVHNIRAGVAELRRRFAPLTVSTIYANPPVGFAGDDFLNLVVAFDTTLPIRALAATLRAIEAAQQPRSDRSKSMARALDLDLLLYEDKVLREHGVQVPRDEITRYAFVLRPLAEIAGDRRHPVLGRTFAELWASADQSRENLKPVKLAL
ncbi:MAG: 2-amino-4-hydroxy-6-hydroxymethyldihydropteridine diphosphokinase [Candidatus Competibacteraceae bacterium]|nr:2-amino-4-hydroxy-6-hydroxymethyldihydropteridine diphosphokinase [Candidatus Competibacteraceae bacterium]